MRDGPWLDVLSLARREARWSGRVPLSALPRLRALVVSESGAGDVQVELGFRIDGSGRLQVAGEAVASATVACSRCMEDVPVRVQASVDARVVSSEAEASELIAECDVIVAPSRDMEVAHLVEDDLLLGLPETGCGDSDSCPNLPPTEYPVASDDASRGRANPFDALAALKTGREVE